MTPEHRRRTLRDVDGSKRGIRTEVEVGEQSVGRSSTGDVGEDTVVGDSDDVEARVPATVGDGDSAGLEGDRLVIDDGDAGGDLDRRPG